MVGGMIAFGILYVIFFFWNCSADNKDQKLASAFLLTISAIIVFSAYLTYKNRNTPTAMDVYQGKTTLEITYRDSVPVDTIIVFKDK